MTTATIPRRRVDAYIRVSRVGKRRGPSFISPLVQREAIEQWAAREQMEVLEIYEEFDESGARADRPLLERAIGRIETEVSAGLVVWRVDRFGRSLHDGLQQIGRIRRVGGRFYSVHDGLDSETEAGRLVLRILLSVAEYRLEGIAAGWDAARRNAVRRGIWTSWPVPVGYRKTRSGRLRPHPTSGPAIAELYRRRADGHTLSMCGDFLMGEGVLTGKGNPGWGTSQVRYVLSSRVYLGEVRSGPYVREGAHEPLTDAATWQAAQAVPLIRRPQIVPALLTSIARCAACSHMLSPAVVRRPGRQPVMTYRCHRYKSGGECPGPGQISASKLEPYVIEVMLDLLRRRRRTPIARVEAAEAAAAAAERALVRYRDNGAILERLGERLWLDGLAVRRERLRRANLEVFDLRAALGVHALPPAAEVARLLPTLEVTQRREYIRKVISTVFVIKGSGPASERVMVCPVGKAPKRLPGRGSIRGVILPVEPRRGWINPRPKEVG